MVNHRGKIYNNRLDQKGRLSFVSPNNGEHRLCFSVEGNSLGQDFRVHVAVEQHLKEENHDHIVKREHLSGMDLRIRQLSDTLQNIKEEQNYFKSRELRFFSTTESTNTRSQWCSIFQILGMALVTGFNIFYLQVPSWAGAVSRREVKAGGVRWRVKRGPSSRPTDERCRSPSAHTNHMCPSPLRHVTDVSSRRMCIL